MAVIQADDEGKGSYRESWTGFMMLEDKSGAREGSLGKTMARSVVWTLSLVF